LKLASGIVKLQKTRQSNKQPGQHALLSPRADDGGQVKAADGIGCFLPFLRAHSWIFGLFLVVATMIAYQPVWHAGFIWDDVEYITNNLTLHSLDGLRQIWFEPGATVQYYPFTFTTFWVEYHLWGLNPLGYHLINVLLHACNAILLWLILRKFSAPGAWLAAGIFALHPVCVESVAWVTERKNTLSGLFYLCSILIALKFWLPVEISSEPRVAERDKGSTASYGSWKFYWLAFVLYVCALCSKTTTLPLPAVILLLVWWKRGRIIWRDIYPLGLFLAVGIAMGLMSMHVENHLIAPGKQWDGSWLERCLLAGRDLWFYLGKLVWPYPLISIYPRRTIQTSEWAGYVPVLAFLVGSSILCWKRDGWGRAPLVALLYFVTMLFLVLGFFNVSYFWYSFVADHFQYLASIGPLALAAAGITMAFVSLGKRNLFLKPAFCGVLLLTLGVLTWRQCRMYADDEALWRTTIDRNPASWSAHYGLGDVLLRKGQPDNAITYFRRALAIQPDYAEAHNGLGNAFLQKNQMDEAVIQFQRALAIQPGYAMAYNNLGNALFRKGQVDEAIISYQKALAIQPGNYEADDNLGNALLQKGRVDEAILHYQTVIGIKSGFAEAYNGLGNALLQKGQVDEAIIQFQKTLAIQPDHVEAHYNLGKALLQKGRTDEAITHFQTAIRIKPDYAEAQNNLGIALAQNGRAEEAILHFQRALVIQPDNAEAHNNLGIVFFQKGQLDEAIIQFQRTLSIRPDFMEAQGGLAHIAWILATSPDPSVRNGAKAVELAQQTDRLSNGRNLVTAATLAAAYAETGRFPEAITNVQRALQLAGNQNNAAMIAKLQAQLKLYQAGSPLRAAGASR
jgi:tetratricopeptide (TPR) repeat protein